LSIEPFTPNLTSIRRTIIKEANPDHPIHDLLAQRWSPYGFDPVRNVSADDLRSLFEAARWAASSFNEQPWRFIVAPRRAQDLHSRVVSCLVGANREWATHAPVLALGIVKHELTDSGKHNRAAVHDLGAASASLTLEATARGLHVHQMIGLHPDKARQEFSIPEGFEAWTALAIGYQAEPAALPQRYRDRDHSPRSRRPLSEFVFGGTFGESSGLL